MPTIFTSAREETINTAAESVFENSTRVPEGQSHSLLHTFCLNPTDVAFEAQHRDESVVLFLRAHPVTQIPWVVAAIVALILPTFFNLIIGEYFEIIQIIFLNLFWHSALFSYVFINLLNWQFNVGLVTQHRVVDVDFHNILYKEVNATMIENIEDVTEKTTGFFASFFRFGSVYVQTAGTNINIEFDNVPNPTEVVRVINKLMRIKGHRRGTIHRPA